MFSLRPYYLRNLHDNVEVKFLGLIVDLKLTWNAFVVRLVTSLNNYLPT